MKGSNISKKGKITPHQNVKRSKGSILLPFTEVSMNIHLLATLFAIGLGLLVLTTNKIFKLVAVRQPILVETRPIVYRRRP
jgi:hypothetical protein